MSAEKDKSSGVLFLKENYSKEQYEFGMKNIMRLFDESVRVDTILSEEKKKLDKAMLIRRVLYPIEWLLTRVFLGKREAEKFKTFHECLLKSYDTPQ